MGVAIEHHVTRKQAHVIDLRACAHAHSAYANFGTSDETYSSVGILLREAKDRSHATLAR